MVNEIPDERVKYFHKDNQGVSAARNFGLSLAKGEWVLFLDADDVLKEHALSVFKAAVIENPDVEVFVSGYSVLVDGKEQNRPCPMEGCCDKPLKYYWRGYFSQELVIHYSRKMQLCLSAILTSVCPLMKICSGTEDVGIL